MPDWRAYVRARLSLSSFRPERHADIVEEIARQLDDAYREARSRGRSEAEAQADAEAHVGDWPTLARALETSARGRQPLVDRWQDRADDRSRADGPGPSLGTMLRQDLVSAWRLMRRSRGVSIVAILSLALGIGANTAIFSVIDALLLRPLPVAHPEGLVAISDPSSQGMGTGTENGARTLFSAREFEGLRDHNEVLSSVLAFSANNLMAPVATSDADTGGRARVVLASGTFFTTLGVNAAAGRVFGADVDAAPMASPVAVVSDEFSRVHLDGPTKAVGRTIRIRQTAFTVIGVLPPSFTGLVVGDVVDVYVPLMMQAVIVPGADWLTQPVGVSRRTMFLHVVGRLKPEVTMSEAQVSLNATFARDLAAEAATITDADRRRNLLDEHLELNDARTGLSPLRSQYARPLVVLMGLVGLLLLLACANVANLVLARATSRRRELALRVALGATRGRLVRQLVTESLLLAGIGAAFGLWISRLGVQALLRLVSASGSPLPLAVPLDLTVLGFTAALAIGTGVLFGLAPAFRATRLDLNAVFRDSAANIAGGGRGRWRWPAGSALAAVQIALSIVLLVSAGLFVRSLQKLAAVPLGFDAGHLLMFAINPGPAGYTTETVRPAYEGLLDRLPTVPGVQRASLSQNGFLYDSDAGGPVSFPDDPTPAGLDMSARMDLAGPGYFATAGIPVILGRDVDARDATGPRGCWLSETMRRRFLPATDPIGRRMILHYSFADETCEIRGVVGDARENELRRDLRPREYLPFFGAATHPIGAVFELHVAGQPEAVIPAVRTLLRAAIPGIEDPEFHTVSDLLGRRLTSDRLVAELASVLGALAVLLASIGVYGVLSYAVTRRVSEIGVRMALGADRARIVWLIAREALVIAAVGATVGVGAALAATRVLDSLLFQLSPRDPVTFAAVVAALFGACAAAAVLPAWRASRTNPIVALRTE